MWIALFPFRWPTTWATEYFGEQLLKARYARGEIEQSEYERRLQDLRR